jgi:hypothetical protein
MADSRVTALDANTTVLSTDLLYLVDDPGGTPKGEKATVANVLKAANRYFTFTVSGTLSVSTGAIRLYNLTGSTLTINEVHACVNTAPTGATLIVDVSENGTTLFTTQSNRPTIAISGFTDSSTTIENASWDNDNYLTMDIDQVGSTVAGSDLTVTVVAS